MIDMIDMYENGKSVAEIAKITRFPVDGVQAVINDYLDELRYDEGSGNKKFGGWDEY
jgi:hypothetical protein